MTMTTGFDEYGTGVVRANAYCCGSVTRQSCVRWLLYFSCFLYVCMYAVETEVAYYLLIVHS